MEKNKKVLAVCKKTYVDEDDMIEYANGKIKEPSDVRIYYKGGNYIVDRKSFDKKYYKLLKNNK